MEDKTHFQRTCRNDSQVDDNEFMDQVGEYWLVFPNRRM